MEKKGWCEGEAGGPEEGRERDAPGGKDVGHGHESKVVDFQPPRQPPHPLPCAARPGAHYDLPHEACQSLVTITYLTSLVSY